LVGYRKGDRVKKKERRQKARGKGFMRTIIENLKGLELWGRGTKPRLPSLGKKKTNRGSLSRTPEGKGEGSQVRS